MPFNSSSPSDAAPSDARKVAYTDVPADQVTIMIAAVAITMQLPCILAKCLQV